MKTKKSKAKKKKLRKEAKAPPPGSDWYRADDAAVGGGLPDPIAEVAADVDQATPERGPFPVVGSARNDAGT